jgi:hypothetical protein
MTTEPAPQPAPRGQPGDARAHLAAIAATLSGHGVPARLTRLGGIPVLTAGQPGDSPDRAAVSIDPGPGLAPQLDCTCIWTPAPGATPQATAGTIIAVLAAIGQDTPGPGRPRPAPVPARRDQDPPAAGTH